MEQFAPPPRLYTVEDYFRFSAGTDQRLEYVDGQIVAMAGALPNHGRIEANIIRAVGNRLDGTPCEVFGSGLQVRLRRRALFSHPDAAVICGGTGLDPADESGRTVLNPTLIIEVLGPSTERYDRNLKFERYRDIDSLRECVLVEQDEPTVIAYHCGPEGLWTFGPTARGVDATIRLDSVGVGLPLAEVYARVTFPPPPPQSRFEWVTGDDGR